MPLFYSHANICLARLALPIANWATLTPALPNHLHCWCLFLARPVGHFSHIIICYLKRITQPVHLLCRKCEKMKTAKLTLIGNHCVRFFCMVWNESTEKTASLYQKYFVSWPNVWQFWHSMCQSLPSNVHLLLPLSKSGDAYSLCMQPEERLLKVVSLSWPKMFILRTSGPIKRMTFGSMKRLILRTFGPVERMTWIHEKTFILRTFGSMKRHKKEEISRMSCDIWMTGKGLTVLALNRLPFLFFFLFSHVCSFVYNCLYLSTGLVYSQPLKLCVKRVCVSKRIPAQ